MARRKPRTRGVGEKGFSPRFLTQEAFAATAVLVICLFVAAGAVEKYVKEAGSPYVAAVLAAVLVDLANDDRDALALPPLAVDPALTAAAEAKAKDMAEKGYFAHTSPGGVDPWHWFKSAGYDYRYAGENLAVNFADSRDVEDAWMASPTHRENIVSPNYTEIGIAVATGTYQGRAAVFAVQMFGRPKDAAAAPAAAVPPAAGAGPGASVLGEATEDTAPAASLGADESASAPSEVPWWGYLLAFPKEGLRYAYYILGLLVLFGLFFDVEWEMHRHHLKHAMKAGIVLATMSMLFIVADWAFFAQPILASLGLHY